MNKTVKYILRGIGLAALLFLGCAIGILMEQNNQRNLERQKESVSTIAVVNMDDGVSVGEEHVNYASQLMSFPNEHFRVTGLNDAKMGIENGYYAAYIVIPETFSMLVTSIENNPGKVILEYQYNSKLEEETQIQAINDVNAFLNLINSNIAYMYIDAILAEFHRIQDDSAAILASDNAELEQLKSVNAVQLIATAEPIDEAKVEFDIQPVEINAYTSQNNTLLESLQSSYLEAVQKGKDDYAAIQENNVDVEAASANFFSAYNAMIADTATTQTELLTAGQNRLNEAVGLHNQNVEDKREYVESMVSDILAEHQAASQQAADQQLAEILESIIHTESTLQVEQLGNNAPSDLQRQLDACLESMEEPLENFSDAAYVQGYQKALSTLEEDIAAWNGDGSTENITMTDIQNMIAEHRTGEILPTVENYNTYADAVKSPLNQISVSWDSYDTTQNYVNTSMADNDYTITLPPYTEEDIAAVTEDLLEIFELGTDSDEISEIIQTYFVDALQNEYQSRLELLSEAMSVLDQEMGDYQSRLGLYDPVQYIESAGLTAYLQDIDNNTRDMTYAVEMNNQEYVEYSTEMYLASTANMSQMRTALDLSNEQTVLNVENCISELKTSREVINGQNVSMLEEFTKSLEYTRLDSKANTEVYDYIVNPVVSQRAGQFTTRSTRSISVPRNNTNEILVIILGIGVVVFIIEIIRGFRRQYRKQEEKVENIY